LIITRAGKAGPADAGPEFIFDTKAMDEAGASKIPSIIRQIVSYCYMGEGEELAQADVDMYIQWTMNKYSQVL